MMSVAPVASAGEAAGYYSNSDNYYFLGSLQSLWMGEGAKALGLEGNVRGDDLTAVLEGRLPDGSRLGKEVNGQHVHRPGHDLTFSAPKSVSILALIGNDKEMVEAHNHAVRVAAGYVEKLISARDTKDGVTSIVHTGKMVAAAYTHDTSRNLDPQLHTHLLIANMTEYTGKWKALATDYIHNAGFIETVMKHQVTLGKIYRSALRERVEALGHEVEEVGKHGMWEIKGVPEDVRDEYSSRGREIQGAVGAEATLRSRDVAAKDTRRAKVDPSRMRLMERWLGQMKEKGFDLKAYQESVVPRDAGLRETAPQPERDHQAKPVPAGPELASLQTSSRAEKSVDTPAQPAERESQSRQAVTQPADTLRQTVQTGPEKTPATRSVPAAQLDTEIPRPELTESVRLAISQLSDSKTRFTFGELMMTTAELSEQLPEIQEIRVAIDAALKDGMIVPLDSEKGVFTSRIHLLDELSIQALSQEHLKSTKVVSFTRPAQYAPAALEVVEKDALVLMNAPSGVAGIRDLTAQLAGIAGANGRDVQVLASSAERAISLAKSDDLRERIISRQHVLSGDFHLKPQSTLIIEGAERLGLKETLVLLGEARAQDAQLHEDTRVLSLIDGDGVLTRMKIGDISADWRLFSRETLSVATGEKLLAVAGDREHSLKAKDRLEVTGISEKGIEVKRGEETLTLPKDQPLYLSHAYVTAPGGRDNDTGVVLAALNSRDISTQTMNSLAQSGHRAEVFTAEVQDRAEARLQRMKTSASPVQLVRNLSGHQDISQAVDSLHDSVRTDAGLAVWRAINDQRTVVFSELKLATEAQKYHPDLEAIGNEIGAMIKNGELLSVSAGGEPVLVSRSTWEMEKAILRVVEEGKGTQQPLLEQVPEAVLNGLTDGQKKATTLVLGTTDQFIGIQGYAGVGKTTQLKAVISALETIPADVRPVMTGLAPTHQAVKEMSDVGVRAQTIKSFIVEHDQATAAGGKPDYKGQVFLIDESSMAGNQDTAALFKAIASGGGRAVSMGDIDQFESVDVGAPFKLMQERSPMDVAIMKQIVRQKDLQLRGAVHDIIDNRIDAALQRIETQPADRVARSASASLPGSAIQETETPVNDIVADWTDRTPEARSRTLIITQLNADRRAVNAGIHAVLAARGELGEKAITVPVLDKITHTRHEFNKTDAWEAGMVVKRGDRYQDVLAVDRNGSTVTVRDEEGKIGLYSLKELITGDVQLFRRSEREVRAGDLLKFTATDKEQGQMASQRYTVESVSETGNIRLKGENGRITINPQAVRAQQHIDYGWAVTGYGAQGASSDYVIALEGTEGGRKALASRCAFYISASRVKEHVQIYTDGKADWVKAVKTPERDIKTAHDALAPETQRKQAKAIWAMGQPVNKTAMGRAWVRHQGMQDASLTAKIIPATRRFPEPALALPVYDNNGRSAGLALVSLVASPEGRMTQGETRMVMTERARGAVLQRSQSGNTIVASDLAAALDAVRHHPKDGVVWQTGDEPPSAHLLKVSGGIVTEAASEHKLIRDQEETTRQTEKDMLNKAVKAEKEKSETQERIVVPVEDAVRITPGMLEVDDRNEPTIPAGKVLIQVASSDSVSHDEIGRHIRAEKEPLASKVASERAGVSRIVNELANTERDIIRQPENSERGRMPEREEQTLTRTIQKER